MEIYLIRHGEPRWVEDDCCVVDPVLTERGERQSRAVARTLAHVQFDQILMSPLRRPQLTAAPLIAQTGATAVVAPWLEEIREPDWHGQHATVAADAYAAERRLSAQQRWAGIPGGEAPRDFVDRVEHGCAGFLSDLGWARTDQQLAVWTIPEVVLDQRIAVFAHAGTNGVILCHLLGFPAVPWEWDRLATAHASITRLTTMQMGDGHALMLASLSDVEHLPVADRTR